MREQGNWRREQIRRDQVRKMILDEVELKRVTLNKRSLASSNSCHLENNGVDETVRLKGGFTFYLM